MREFFKVMGRVCWNGIRYLAFSAAMLFAVLSLTTGQFPPPVIEIYKSLSQNKDSMDLSKNLQNIQQSKIDHEKLLNEINNSDAPAVDRSPASAAPVDVNETVKSLEYEVAYLKAKVSRLEAGSQQACPEAKTAP
jgi:hypothetical protein